MKTIKLITFIALTGGLIFSAGCARRDHQPMPVAGPPAIVPGDARAKFFNYHFRPESDSLAA